MLEIIYKLDMERLIRKNGYQTMKRLCPKETNEYTTTKKTYQPSRKEETV